MDETPRQSRRRRRAADRRRRRREWRRSTPADGARRAFGPRAPLVMVLTSPFILGALTLATGIVDLGGGVSSCAP